MKRYLLVLLACSIAGRAVSAQSLAEAARKETERRRQLAEQGIEARVIEGDGRGQAAKGNLTTFTRDASQKKLPARDSEPKGRTSASTYRGLLQKLDRAILESEERRDLLRRQAEAAKWSLPRVGRTGRSSGAPSTQERLLRQVEGLEVKLRQLRRQRQETYQAGRKAGFLPGELDGKGIVP